MSAADGRFAPTHKVRERGTEAWIEVRADGTEPQTYYDREGKTIYAGIWFQNMEVRRLTPAQRVEVTDDMVDACATGLFPYWDEWDETSKAQHRPVIRKGIENALSAALGGEDK